jgi:hypothetical protein
MAQRWRGWSVVAVATVLSVAAVFAFGLLGGGLATAPDAGATPLAPSLAPANSPLTATLAISPQTIQQGSSTDIQTVANGGTPPYAYSYNGLPSSCAGENAASFECNPTQSGTYSVTAQVIDANGNTSESNVVTLTVTSSNSGNGNGNSSNSSNPFSGLLSGLGGVLTYVLIFGVIGFVTWILLVVGIWVIAVVLMRRLPRPGAQSATSTTTCPSCAKSIPGGTKFCPECGASTATAKS